MKLRDYQEECLEVLPKHQKQLIVLPTGSGKTFIFLKYLRQNSKKALIVVPTLDLKNQTYEAALSFFHQSEISLNHAKIQKLNIVVAKSLNKKTNYLTHHFEVIIVDEAHKTFCKTYLFFLENYRFQHQLIGFTATPERLDRKSLLKIFDKITYQKNIFEMIEKNWLCNICSYRIETKHNLISQNKSDFTAHELRNLDMPSRNNLIYKTYEENCKDKKTLIFCVSIDHAEKVAEYMRKEKGIAAFHISGRQNENMRKQILKDFKEGKIKVLTNCQLLTEGFDEPSIEALIMARPTRSKALYAQMIGRGLRKFPGKEKCYLYELTDNTHKICNFNVLADETKPLSFIKPYRDGISLSELREEIEKISLTDYLLEKKEISVFESFRTFEDFLISQDILDIQQEKLEGDLKIFGKLNLYEAAFLEFKQRLKEKYGFNY